MGECFKLHHMAIVLSVCFKLSQSIRIEESFSAKELIKFKKKTVCLAQKAYLLDVSISFVDNFVSNVKKLVYIKKKVMFVEILLNNQVFGEQRRVDWISEQ